MAAFTQTWNDSFEEIPADTEDESLGATRIRETKVATGERLAIDHSLSGDGEDGKHLWVTLKPRASGAPRTLDIGDGSLWITTASTGVVELFYQDNFGQVTQLTRSGEIGPLPASPIPAGSGMIFVQAATPVGWTLSSAYDDRLIRFNAGNGGITGGTWTISGLTTSDHTLTTAETPSHTHLEYVGQGAGGGNLAWSVSAGNSILGSGINTGPAGGDGAHNHGAVVSDGDWRPAFVDALYCIKS